MKIALCGIGKAGMQVLWGVHEQPDLQLTAAFCKNGSDKAGKRICDITPARKMEAPLYEVRDAQQAFEANCPDVLIDFSDKSATLELLPVCARYGVKMVVCTTGFTEEERNRLKEMGATEHFAIVYAPNVTIGINVLMRLAKQTAKCLPEFDYLITERHYRKKKDKISATATLIQETLSKELNKKVSLNAMRAGGYVGYHEVSAVGECERITIIHESFSRQAFARGALLAARYLQNRNGYFEMQDLITTYLDETN